MNAEHPGSSWDWQRELENFCSRTSRGRAEEAAAFRRSSEEAERSALRRIEDVERQMVRSQAEEASMLQSFFSGWNGSFEARLERQRVQCMTRIDAVERHAAEEVERSSSQATTSQELAAEANRLAAGVAEALPKHLDELKAELRSKVAVDMACELERFKEILEALKREMLEQAAARDRHAQHAMMDLAARMEAVESGNGANLHKIAEIGSSVDRFASLMPQLETASEKLQQGMNSELEKQGSEVAELRGRLDSHHQGLRVALEATDKKHGDSFNGMCEELRAMRGHCDSRLETQARLTADTCKRLEGGFREMIDDATERAELAAANLDSKVAGALDAVMDARVAKGTKECIEEARAAAGALEGKLRCTEAVTERLREELQQSKTGREVQMNTEICTLRAELRSYLQESSEDLRTVTASCGQLSMDLKKLQCQGLTHEWCIPRCMHRIRYLSMSEEAGLWLDSDPFTLGSLGPLTLRLFPRGMRGGDGQCAIALRIAKDAVDACGLYLVPAVIDLAVGNLRGRAAQRPDEAGAGGIMWLADGLGDVEAHCVKGSDDLLIRAELPSAQATTSTSSAVDAAAGVEQLLTAGVAEDLTVPQELRSALQQRLGSDVEHDVPTPAAASSAEFRGVDGTSGTALLSQDTLVPDDVASTTAGSDAGAGAGSSLGSKLRNFWKSEGSSWKRDAPLKEPATPSQAASSPVASPTPPSAAATAAFNTAPTLPNMAAFNTAPAQPTAAAAAATATASGPSGVFALQSTWTSFPGKGFQDSRGAVDAATARPTGLTSGSPFAPSARGPPTGSRTNPFEVTNPFETGFSGEGGPLPGSPTPSFATVSSSPLGDPVAAKAAALGHAGGLGVAAKAAAQPAMSPTAARGVPGRLEVGSVNPI